MNLIFASSAFAPLALGFFGLGTGYLIYGPEELFHWPKRNESVDKSTGVWGIWLPGFCQLVTGIILFVGMTWFQVFKDAPLYMAALAFSAYGIHWFALGYNRWQGVDPRTNAGMSVAYTILSVLGIVVFFIAGDWPVGLLFVGLTLIYISDFFHSIGQAWGERSLGLWHLVTGLWLMYLTFATGLNFSLGMKLPL
ncbi:MULTISPECIES: hypothetical protein [unclassified Arthrobacter]|uniref:hypothetical protein n=1 Tax=unclassified Arthrobacter TaxID=235627 RepID=UPI00159E178E|nr:MULTISPECIES: hypothetical protein [unclassified Arthrobacter]MCQ9164887.1 hypothetical protein [Arthrobacter sp. STN4]NVM98183.1 hypothetical protein [Arthrobacter sp. SDTb3-6]